MALPNCNPWASNTVRDSDQQVACTERSGRADQYELEEATFFATVIDSLQRLAKASVSGWQPLSAYNACDGESNAHNAYCVLNPVSLPMQTITTEQKQIILWQLANALCANNA